MNAISRPTLFVCSTCRRGTEPLDPMEGRSGFRLAAAVKAAAMDHDIAVVPVECLSNCSKGCTVAFAGPGKWSYVIGDLDPAAHVADILSFARQHADHDEGVPVWRERPAHIRRNVIARIPPLTPAIKQERPLTATLAKTPCTIITGFLGAGKTTLVRHVLENAGGRRLAVIVNEFGDVGIDGEILKGCGIESCSEDRIVELSNGCLCCTVADDFVPTLNGLLGLAEPPEHIVIETSGLALPKPLVQAFNWPEIASRVTVDGVVAVVDGAAVAAGRFADDPDAVARQRAEDASVEHENPLEEVYEDQLLCADLIILNKADLMSEAERVSVTGEIEKVVSRAVKIVGAENGRVPTAVLLGLGAAAEGDLANRPSHHDAEEGHDHDDFDSFIVEVPRLAAPQELVERISRAAQAHDILRVKGFIDIEGKPMRLLVQGVGNRIQHQFDRPWRAGEERQGRIVVIGEKGLDAEAIRGIITG
jgi:cobalamin biosynthesis protein CobW